MTAQVEFHARVQDMYNHFWNRWQESCEEALRVAWDAHCWALVAATLLEGHIERLGHSISHGQSSSQHQLGSYWHLGSRGHTRSCRRCLPAGQEEQVPSAADCTGDPAKRWAPSPSPVILRRWVAFEESSPRRDTEVKQAPPPTGGRQSLEATGSQLWSWMEEPEDLGYPPKLDPVVQEFLSGTRTSDIGDDESNQSLTPEPSFDDSNEWVKWHACWVETLAW